MNRWCAKYAFIMRCVCADLELDARRPRDVPYAHSIAKTRLDVTKSRMVIIAWAHLVKVPLEALEVLRLPELAHIDHLVCRARSEGIVVAPIHIERRLLRATRVSRSAQSAHFV